MQASHTRLLYHIVFATHNREPWLDEAIRGPIFAYIAGVAKNIGGKALIVNGMPDHVHILCSLPPTLAVSRAVQAIKANSSRWYHETTHRAGFAWQEGYGGFTVSPRSVNAVYSYIQRQQEHHRLKTFAQEYDEFCEMAGLLDANEMGQEREGEELGS